jgi:oligopeptidase B
MREKETTPPVAKTVPVQLEKHGDVRTDNYFWLNDRENPDVIAYLEAENAYTDAVLESTQGLQGTLFDEIKGRIKQTDESVPYQLDGYYYYTRFEDGKEYPVHCRKKGSLDAPEQVILDVNLLAEGHAFCSVAPLAVSPDQDLLAYAVDTVGRRIFTLHIRDLHTGELLDDVIPEMTGNVTWSEEEATLFYTRQDPVTLRWHRVYRHVVGTDAARDPLVFEETDETYRCGVYKTKSKGYMIIVSRQTLATEYRYLEADQPNGDFCVFLPRERDHEYHVDHRGDHFYIRTNDQARNFRLMKTPVDQTDRGHWTEVIPHRDDVLVEDFELFRDHLVVLERAQGLKQLHILPSPAPGGDAEGPGTGEHLIAFDEPAYTAVPSDNHRLDTPILRYTYTSLTTPPSVYDYNMVTRERTLLKREEVLGGYDPANYRTERLWATAGDGAQVPISIVYRRAMERDGANPLLLYGYGSYGISIDATFSAERVSLIDRGFVFAIAHVRGGQEMGRGWYEDGKLFKKKNTFADFIACAEHLVQEGYTRPDRLYALGGSAGGLLMGAVLNMRPDLFHGVVARVPFVDVVTTMLDESIPLTTSEYDEWGDPNEKPYYDYMLSYSPYDNVAAQAYPNLLVTTSLHDSQVQYFEPAKWVAKLRAIKKGGNRLLLRTKMQAGHGGVSGRYKQYEETAFIYAFLLTLAGIGE